MFGYVLGGTVRTIGGHKYIEFVMPGVLMMNIITAAFLQSSSAIYFSRFIRFVEEILVAPLSYLEMIVGSLSVGAIDTGLLINILEPIWSAKPETAGRVRGRAGQAGGCSLGQPVAGARRTCAN